jgi:acyl-CoA dehydrogenase
MMCERALSRRTQGDVLANKQIVQQYIADSFIQLEQFRLLVLYTAWHIDKGHKKEARTYIAAVKVQMATCSTTWCAARCRCTVRSAAPTRCRSPASG